MDRMDDLITRALNDEDRALLAQHAEPSYFAQATGLFRGPLAWTMWLAYTVGGVAFVFAAWALWRMGIAIDALEAVRWGVGALVLLQFTMLTKTFMGSHMEANRMLREIKRLELQVAMLRNERDTPVAR
jgi:hypothetical protein